MLGTLGIAGVANPPLNARPEQLLSAAEQRILSAAGEAFVPGAAAAGIVPFVSTMLSSHRPALFYDYFNLPLEPVAFYRAALHGIGSLAPRNGAFDALPVDARGRLLLGLLSPDIRGWSGPPPGLVYTVLRNDALDVVYGTEAAYTHVGIPYMPHIEPPKPW